MKLKILILPLVIVTVMYLAIWVIAPAYSDADATRNRLTVAEDKLTDIKNKTDNANKLVQQLSFTSDQQNTLVQYLPENKREEEVISSINSIAAANGVSMLSLGLETKADLQEQVVFEEEFVNANLSPEQMFAMLPKKTSAKNLSASITVVGEYAKIRNFVISLNKFKRFNEITSLEIQRSGNENELLQANMAIGLNYLPKIESMVGINNEIFGEGKFDMSVVDEINKNTTDVSKVEVGSRGRANPFAL